MQVHGLQDGRVGGRSLVNDGEGEGNNAEARDGGLGEADDGSEGEAERAGGGDPENGFERGGRGGGGGKCFRKVNLAAGVRGAAEERRGGGDGVRRGGVDGVEANGVENGGGAVALAVVPIAGGDEDHAPSAFGVFDFGQPLAEVIGDIHGRETGRGEVVAGKLYDGDAAVGLLQGVEALGRKAEGGGDEGTGGAAVRDEQDVVSGKAGEEAGPKGGGAFKEIDDRAAAVHQEVLRVVPPGAVEIGGFVADLGERPALPEGQVDFAQVGVGFQGGSAGAGELLVDELGGLGGAAEGAGDDGVQRRVEQVTTGGLGGRDATRSEHGFVAASLKAAGGVEGALAMANEEEAGQGE